MTQEPHITDEQRAEMTALIRSGIGRMPESKRCKMTIWEFRQEAEGSLNLGQFLVEAYMATVPVKDRIAWRESTLLELYDHAMLDFLKGTIGEAFTLSVPTGPHAGQVGKAREWRQGSDIDGLGEVGLEVEGASDLIWVRAEEIVLPWDMPSAAPAPR